MEKPAAAMAALPDDVLREILVHVADAGALLRCAMASKRWCVLVCQASSTRHHRRSVSNKLQQESRRLLQLAKG
jgi:hypothetical protein